MLQKILPYVWHVAATHPLGKLYAGIGIMSFDRRVARQSLATASKRAQGPFRQRLIRETGHGAPALDLRWLARSDASDTIAT